MINAHPEKHFQVGVIGAGVMGRGVTEAVASRKHNVLLIDISEGLLRSAEDEIRRQLMAKSIRGLSKGSKISDVMSRIEFSLSYAGLNRCDIVIENAVESFEVKREVYRDLGRACGPATLVAANTSTFPIDELATLIPNPQRLVGTHFMNPVPAKPVVEVIRGAATSADTLTATIEFLAAIGKEAIVVADAPGFVSNRVLMLVVNEAIQLVERGTATAEDVDRIFTGCFGHPMGPLTTCDLIGLDTVLLSLVSLQARVDEEKYRPAGLLRSMVSRGCLGRKSGRGFFRYED